MKHILIPLVLIFFYFHIARAGRMELRSELLTTANGLPSNTVRHIWQDSKGFIWFGTNNGLSRYDGNNFLNFHTDLHEPGHLSLTDDKIIKQLEDSQGFLWVGVANRKFCCYDLHEGRFTDFMGKDNMQSYLNISLLPNDEVWLYDEKNGARLIVYEEGRKLSSIAFTGKNGTLPDSRIRFIFQDSSGQDWIGTRKGIAVCRQGKTRILDRDLSFFAAVEHKQRIYLASRDGHIYQASENNLKEVAALPSAYGKQRMTGTFQLQDRWTLLTDKGVFRFDFASGQLTEDPTLNIKKGEVLTDDCNDYWIYNKSGHVHYIQSATGKVREFDFFPKEKINLIDRERYVVRRTPDGLAWISTYGNGLFIYDTATDQLEHFTSGREKDNTLNSDYILYLAQDRAGGMWVSMERGGLQRLSIQNRGVRHITPESPSLFNQANRVRMMAMMQDGNLLMGTGNGKLHTYTPDGVLKKTESLPANAYCCAQDADGKIWTGTRGKGIRIGNTWYENDPEDSTSLSGNDVFSLLCDSKKRMWIGTLENGLNLAIPASGNQYVFRHFTWDEIGLNSIRAMQESSDGKIWAGTSGGLYIFHPDSLLAGKSGYNFSLNNGKFCANELRCLYPDKEGKMWVGTSGGGLTLCTFNEKEGKLEYSQFRQKDGLVQDLIQSILKDRKDRLWISTEYGISRFDPSNRSFENYFFSSYMQGNVYSESTAVTDASGNLYFGSDYGVTLIDPDKVEENITVSPVVLTRLYINGNPITPMSNQSPLEHALPYSEKIVLEDYQNSFLLNFSVFNYNGNGQTQYMYWLENYDDGWNAASNQSFASYKYLAPGTYRFHVKAYGQPGTENSQETILKIVIRPPYWKSDWALFIYIVLAFLISGFTWHIIAKFNRLRAQIIVEEQLTEYKLVFFTNISHEFRTPLTLIRGALEKIKGTQLPMEAQNALRTMDKSTGRMLRLVNQLLTFRKIQNNKLTLALEETDVMNFLKGIFQDFHELAEQKKMDFRFAPSVPVYAMFVDRENLDKVIYNLLSNAFKYTPAGGRITLSATVDEPARQLKIQVTDTGVGIPPEKQDEIFSRFMQTHFSHDSVGVGLHLTRELVQIHKGTITYTDNPTGGSVFTVVLPTDSSIYNKEDFAEPDPILATEEKQAEAETFTLTAEAQAELEKNIGPLNQHKILIIEDDTDVRRFLQEEIGKYFQVETAENGTSGLQTAQEYAPDLIVCDVMMPGMNGFDVTRKLKHDFATSHIPVILLTALTSVEKQTEGIDSGADAYVSKPFSPKLLLTRILRLIEQREKLREKYTNEPGMIHAAMYTTNHDREFMEKMNRILEMNLQNEDFTIEELSQQMQLSRTVFYKKVKGLTGYAPVEYLRIVRLKKSAELLLSEKGITVAEVAFRVGFGDPSYFSRLFKSQFGIAPSAYQKGGEK